MKRVRKVCASARRTGGWLKDAWMPSDTASVQSNDRAMHFPEDGVYSVKEQMSSTQINRLPANVNSPQKPGEGPKGK